MNMTNRAEPPCTDKAGQLASAIENKAEELAEQMIKEGRVMIANNLLKNDEYISLCEAIEMLGCLENEEANAIVSCAFTGQITLDQMETLTAYIRDMLEQDYSEEITKLLEA